jgi:hypothetical protein
VDPAIEVPANPSLGAPEVALVREVNRRLGDRLPTDVRNRVVKREWAEQGLARRASPPARTPAALGPLLRQATERWVEEVRAAGHHVHGDTADLAPVLAGPGDPPPDQPWPADLDPDVVAARLLERAGVRRRRRWWPSKA